MFTLTSCLCVTESRREKHHSKQTKVASVSVTSQDVVVASHTSGHKPETLNLFRGRFLFSPWPWHPAAQRRTVVHKLCLMQDNEQAFGLILFDARKIHN